MFSLVEKLTEVLDKAGDDYIQDAVLEMLLCTRGKTMKDK